MSIKLFPIILSTSSPLSFPIFFIVGHHARPRPAAWRAWLKPGLPHGLMHNLQTYRWSVTSNIARRSREVYLPWPPTWPEDLWWAWGLPEGSLLPSPSLPFKTWNLCVIKQTFLASLSLVVLVAWGHRLLHPWWPRGLLAGLNVRLHLLSFPSSFPSSDFPSSLPNFAFLVFLPCPHSSL